MKFSNIYLIYPENRALERSIADSMGMLGEEMIASSAPDRQVTAADNFLYTRGSHEQHRFSSKIHEPLIEALEAGPDTAEKQGRLGNVLAALGQQRRDAALYERAVQCFEHALQALTQEESPAEWAAAQYNLGTANQALGRLLDAAKPLKNAADAYTQALQVWKREAHPEDWMRTMHQLGATLHAHGKLLKGNRQLQKSVVAYKNALAALDADNYALELTAAHNNRAAALHHLGESESNADRLREAIKSYEKALTVSMEQQLPIHLAVICRVNKATAQNVLARMTGDAALAEENADEFEVIMECFPHALQPLCLKHCRDQMEGAQLLREEKSNSSGKLVFHVDE